MDTIERLVSEIEAARASGDEVEVKRIESRIRDFRKHTGPRALEGVGRIEIPAKDILKMLTNRKA